MRFSPFQVPGSETPTQPSNERFTYCVHGSLAGDPDVLSSILHSVENASDAFGRRAQWHGFPATYVGWRGSGRVYLLRRARVDGRQRPAAGVGFPATYVGWRGSGHAYLRRRARVDGRQRPPAGVCFPATYVGWRGSGRAYLRRG